MTCIDTKYRTALPVCNNPPFRLSAGQAVLLSGSCFTDNIGGKMLDSGMEAYVNPAGVQYNPASIAAVIRASICGKLPEESIFIAEDRVRSWLLPTRFSSTEKTEAEKIFAETVSALRQALLRAKTIIITFGTAWIYEHIPTPLSAYTGITGNCHKVPAQEFVRRRLSVQEIVTDWEQLIAEIKAFRGAEGIEAPDIIFTVSPIRHFKDGAHENTLSKSTLHLSVEELCEYHKENAAYFPAYELLMDDLRDYRFYAEDMVHPSPVAVDYVWQYFQHTFFSPADRDRLSAQAKSLRTTRHRPLL